MLRDVISVTVAPRPPASDPYTSPPPVLRQPSRRCSAVVCQMHQINSVSIADRLQREETGLCVACIAALETLSDKEVDYSKYYISRPQMLGWQECL